MESKFGHSPYPNCASYGQSLSHMLFHGVMHKFVTSFQRKFINLFTLTFYEMYVSLEFLSQYICESHKGVTPALIRKNSCHNFHVTNP